MSSSAGGSSAAGTPRSAARRSAREARSAASASATPEGDELLALAAAGHRDREHGAHAAGVELVLEHLRLQRRELLGEQRAAEVAERHLCLVAAAEDARTVLGVARVVLLAVGHAH